jgi:hypothetical protein
MAREAFQRLVERAGRAAGLDSAVHPHMLRHACGYRLANEGKDAFAIQGWLGHQSLGWAEVGGRLASRTRARPSPHKPATAGLPVPLDYVRRHLPHVSRTVRGRSLSVQTHKSRDLTL